MEFVGDGVEQLSVSQRQIIANMCVECGAFTGIFPSDEQTRIFLRAQCREEVYQPLAADSDANYDWNLTIDLNMLEPLVACPAIQTLNEFSRKLKK